MTGETGMVNRGYGCTGDPYDPCHRSKRYRRPHWRHSRCNRHAPKRHGASIPAGPGFAAV